MSKADNNQLKKNNDQYHDTTATQLGGLMGQQQGILNNAQATQSSTFNGAQAGYQDQQNTGGFDPSKMADLYGNTKQLMGTGGYDPTQVASLNTSLQNAESTGGFDPNTMQYLTDQGKSFASTGGVDPSTAGQVTQGYGDFASTGGYTEQAKANYLNRATAGVDKTYEALQQQGEQAKNKTGGLGTGGDLSRMARQLGQDQASSTLNAQDSLNTQINSNKLAGLGGLDTSSRGTASLKQHALDSMGSLESSAAGNRMNALQQKQSLETGQAAGRRDANSQGIDLANKEAVGKQLANSGMAHLYDTASGQVSEQGRQLLASMGLNLQNNDQALRVLLGLATSQVTGRGAMGMISDIGAVASQAAGGAAGLTTAIKA